jgi:beta-glucanase (GH16 family)
MTFSDEFNGASLDRNVWRTAYGWGDRTNNDELEWYVDNANEVSGGTLKLIAKEESAVPGFPYTSGLISGDRSLVQMYGYFEARMKLPRGRGLWPAFWLLPSPFTWPPEIDVMENLGDDTTTVYLTNHWSANYPNPGLPWGGSEGGIYQGPDYASDFHTYGVEWNAETIIWYLDGVERCRTSNYVPIAGHGFTGFYMIANLAVGGSWPGPPDDNTVFPALLEIDYIRAFAKR